MKYLLDTHTFMWWDSNSTELSQAVYDIISDSKNQIYLSTVSTWEMTIKVQIGKLSLKDDLSKIVAKQIKDNGFLILPIELSHTLKVGELPLHHKDPFDRLLIAQSLIEGTTLLSKDAVFQNYSATVLW